MEKRREKKSLVVMAWTRKNGVDKIHAKIEIASRFIDEGEGGVYVDREKYPRDQQVSGIRPWHVDENGWEWRPWYLWDSWGEGDRDYLERDFPLDHDDPEGSRERALEWITEVIRELRDHFREYLENKRLCTHKKMVILTDD